MKRSKLLSAVLLTLCTSVIFTGCGSQNSGNQNNDTQNSDAQNSDAQSGDAEKSDAEKSDSESVSKSCAYSCPSTGFGFDLPEGMTFSKGYITVKDVGDVNYDSGVMMGWPVYRDMTEEEVSKLTDETLDQLHVGFSFRILCVKDVNSEEEAKEKIFAVMEEMMGEVPEEEKELYSSLKMIHQENGYIWLYLNLEKEEDIREESKEEYDTFYNATDQIISNMKFFTPEKWEGTEEGADVSFETIDLDGNTVNSKDLFAQNKVTMINIWGTTCGPCVNEMPVLEQMNKEFQARGGAVVGLVDDVRVNDQQYLEDARSIIKDTGVTYLNLCSWDGFDEMLACIGTPTTYFVDSHGKLLGEPVLGAYPEKYKEFMEEYLSKAECSARDRPPAFAAGNLITGQEHDRISSLQNTYM